MGIIDVRVEGRVQRNKSATGALTQSCLLANTRTALFLMRGSFTIVCERANSTTNATQQL